MSARRLIAAAGLLFTCAAHAGDDHGDFPTVVGELWISALGTPSDASNGVLHNAAAAAFGRRLFFDRRLSANGEFSCSHCHQPARDFTDGLPRARALGETARRTPSVVGAAWQPWQFWDGRRDSTWAQALVPLENPLEHGLTRTSLAHRIADHHRAEYESLFGPLPELEDGRRFPASAGPNGDRYDRSAWDNMHRQDRLAVDHLFANVGKVIAAYEALLRPGQSQFDRYVSALFTGDNERADQILNPDERAGLVLFTGRAQCVKCHNGPLFTNGEFHNTGVPNPTGDRGRAGGVEQVFADSFNCLGAFSDASASQCLELEYALRDAPQLEGAFKVPGLRNVTQRGPYMHAGQFRTLAEVVDHYDRALPATTGTSEILPLNLSAEEKRQLIAFLATLESPPDVHPEWLTAPQ
ncbi:MAG: hypothetical protein KDG50_09165 [Chromatiales bacterium]|nr:hypothetical protein [Chromatiales bacterium]